MKTKVLLWILCLVVTAETFAQSDLFTISENNVSLKKILKIIENNSKYSFAHRKEYLEHIGKVSVHVQKQPLVEVLNQALNGQYVEYEIVGDSIIVIRSAAKVFNGVTSLIAVKGRVLNEAGTPLEGVTVTVLKTNRGTFTNEKGEFSLPGIHPQATLHFSYIGFEPDELPLQYRPDIEMRLKAAAVKSMDETVIIGYGKTTKRLNTGSVHKISANEIARQPVANPLAAMQSLVPGLLITQSNGLPGTAYKVQLRGQSSIGIDPGNLPPNDPLFIIDGVPFAPNNTPLQVISSGTALGGSGRSPLAVINPADIESIEVLKDADATAIYGSRGANGVILFTTKKGKPGEPITTANIYSGVGRITRHIDMLNTKDYIRMRKLALQNDSLTPDADNAPDLTVWDTTRYTNFKDLLIGNTASITDVQLSLTGGIDRFNYLIGTGFNRQTTVFPGDLYNNRASLHLSLRHQSKDNRLSAGLSFLYAADDNHSITTDITELIKLPPNAPALFSSDGRLNWEEGGKAFINPMSYLSRPYEANTANFLTAVDFLYRVNKNLHVKANVGYNGVSADEIAIIPRASLDTFSLPGIQAHSFFGNTDIKSFIAEPQVEYTAYIKKHKFSLMVGASYQYTTHRLTNTTATGFMNDAALRHPHEAAQLDSSVINTDYKYVGVFARLHYLYNDKYIVNLTARRDGSSRFGPSKQFGNFGAMGLGWIFSNTKFLKDHLPFVSFGKIRGSYGITGTDRIGDYKYLDKWEIAPNNYLGQPGIVPLQLADSNYSWEVSRKLETAIELGLLDNQIQLSASYYHNRNSNQLIAYPLPSTTGFLKYEAKNSSAVVQNTGWEIILRVKSKDGKRVEWMNALSVTIPRNKLIDFPALPGSDYENELMVGQPLSVKSGFHYIGVPCSNCLFRFEDKDGDGQLTQKKDYQILRAIDPQWYGNITNNIRYKNWQLDLSWEIRVQNAFNYLQTIYGRYPPGKALHNQPANVFSNSYQLFSTGINPAVGEAIDTFLVSDGVISNASFLRLRNLSLLYTMPVKWQEKLHLKSGRIYIQAQNLLTFTKFYGTDPETQNLETLPPLRIITAGIQLSF